MSDKSYNLHINSGPLKGQTLELYEGVTLLVGGNGAGKTEILNAIKNGTVQFNNDSRNLTYVAYEWGETEYNYKRGEEKGFQDLNPFFKDLGQPTIIEEEIGTRKNTIYDKDSGKRKTVTESELVSKRLGSQFHPSQFSLGTEKVFTKFQWNGQGKPYPEGRTYPGVGGTRSANCVFLLWDEPENSLHPDLQKSIPSRIETWLKTNDSRFHGLHNSVRPIFILVATHSPFILSGIARQDFYNVICLDKCKVLGDSKKKSLQEMRLFSNKMLGLGISDIFPGELVLTENSVAVLLKGLAMKFNLEIEKFIITVAGEDAMETKFKNFANVYSVFSELQDKWPEKLIFNDINVSLIADEDGKVKNLKKVKNKGFNITVSSVGKKDLEDSYPLDEVNNFLRKNDFKENWDPSKEGFSAFLFRTQKWKDKERGTFKQELAIYIVEITNSYELVKSTMPRIYDFFENWNSTNKQ